MPRDGQQATLDAQGENTEPDSPYEDRRGHPIAHQDVRDRPETLDGNETSVPGARTEAGLSSPPRSLRTGDGPSGSSGRFIFDAGPYILSNNEVPAFSGGLRQEPLRSQAPSYLTPNRPPHARRLRFSTPTPTKDEAVEEGTGGRWIMVVVTGRHLGLGTIA